MNAGIFADVGADYLSGYAASLVGTLAAIFAEQERPGIRITQLGHIHPCLVAGGLIGTLAREYIGDDARPVRAIAFDKTVRNNWALDWHQDRTICVASRANVPGFGPWSVKNGLQHVAPPFPLLSRMITIRIHLDAVDEANAPLLIAPGSHRLGRIPESEVHGTVARLGSLSCITDEGGVWVYSTPILHASARSDGKTRRRVLQVDYSADELPKPLSRLGIA